MTTVNFSTCVSTVEEISRKKVATSDCPMPVTIKTFPSVYFEEDSYEGHNHSLIETEFQTWNGRDGRSGFMMEEIINCDAGELTGRVYGDFLDLLDPYSWPTVDELEDFVAGVADRWYGKDFRSVIFSVYEIEEHTADYLCGVLRWYEYYHDKHRLDHWERDDEKIVIVLHPNDR